MSTKTATAEPPKAERKRCVYTLADVYAGIERIDREIADAKTEKRKRAMEYNCANGQAALYRDASDEQARDLAYEALSAVTHRVTVLEAQRADLVDYQLIAVNFDQIYIDEVTWQAENNAYSIEMAELLGEQKVGNEHDARLESERYLLSLQTTSGGRQDPEKVARLKEVKAEIAIRAARNRIRDDRIDYLRPRIRTGSVPPSFADRRARYIEQHRDALRATGRID